MDEGPRFIRGLLYALLLAGIFWTVVLLSLLIPFM